MPVSHLGFTGTRNGMTADQQSVVRRLLQTLHPDVVHHGDCIGADAQFHRAVRNLLPTATIIGHPPDNGSQRAHCTFDVEREPQPYLDRNHQIVAEADAMLATPSGYRNVPRGSGTWATIRHTKTIGRLLFIVWPDGSVTKEA